MLKQKIDLKRRLKEGVALGTAAVGGHALKNWMAAKSAAKMGSKDLAMKGHRIWAEEALKRARAAKTGAVGAAKVGTAAGLGAVAGAAGLGALAIRSAKRKFDKTVDEGVKTTDSNYKDLMKAIKRRRNKKSK